MTPKQNHMLFDVEEIVRRYIELLLYKNWAIQEEDLVDISILQKVWDEKLKSTRPMLVLCGSYIGMMETEVLGYQAPLYGRRTASTFLRPLDLPSSSLFFPPRTNWRLVGPGYRD